MTFADDAYRLAETDPQRLAAIAVDLHGQCHANPNANPAVTWNRTQAPVRWTHYVWDNNEVCPLGWVPVCRRCGNGPLTGAEEAVGFCPGCAAGESVGFPVMDGPPPPGDATRNETI